MKPQAPLPLHIAKSLKAAWEVVKLNPQAVLLFDRSAEGFWRSFWVIPLGLPILLLWAYLGYDKALEQGQTALIWGNLLAYSFQIPLFALCMIPYTKFININKYYSQMIIAYNWLSLLALIIVRLIELILWSGLFPAKISLLVTMAVMFYLNIFVSWFLFKQSLQISRMLAVGVTVFEVLFSLALLSLLLKLFSLPLP